MISPSSAKVASPDINFGYSFPAIRGIQANRAYYVSMCPLRIIPKIFLFNSEELPPELRAQRRLNRSRLPEMANYIVRNKDDYVLSAITASIDGDVQFQPLSENNDTSRIGMLHVSMEARFIINDGQHRHAAIEKALEDRPELGDESVAVVFFLDTGLNRCQQMFADLNRYAIRPSTSVGILYDHRDGHALLTKRLISDSKVFTNLVETEKTTLSARSRRLFTLSAIYGATNDLLAGMTRDDTQKLVNIAGKFWEKITSLIREWQLVSKGKLTAGEVRQDYIHSHAVVLQSLGKVGNFLLLSHPQDWKKRLTRLSEIDWRKSNPLWQGRALIGGRVAKNQQTVILTTSAIKRILKLPLSPEEQKTEDAFKQS